MVCTAATTPQAQPRVSGTQSALEAGVQDPGCAAERSVRWVGWQPTETSRIERARTRHGVLNLVPRARRARAELMGALQECATLLAVEQRDGWRQ
eukprot:103207-Prymnesium_polylepis.1